MPPRLDCTPAELQHPLHGPDAVGGDAPDCSPGGAACAGTQSLGEPLKIQTWGQFYRATGPPVIARTCAFVVACFAAGAGQTAFAHAVNTAAAPVSK